LSQNYFVSFQSNQNNQSNVFISQGYRVANILK